MRPHHRFDLRMKKKAKPSPTAKELLRKLEQKQAEADVLMQMYAALHRRGAPTSIVETPRSKEEEE